MRHKQREYELCFCRLCGKSYKENARNISMITVIGKLKDTQKYSGLAGFCVLANRPDWSEKMQSKFIETAMREGHALLFASWQADGQYRNELVQILAHLTSRVADPPPAPAK